MKIIVIGAGILGLTAAYSMKKRGHEVTIVEKDRPFAGASHRSFAWLNANNKFPQSYYRINRAGLDEHKRFQTEFPSERTWLHPSGNILVDFTDTRDATYAKRLSDANDMGYPVEKIDLGRLRELEPSAQWPEEIDSALFYPEEAWLDNDVLGEELLRVLTEHGVEVRTATVTYVDSDPNEARVNLSDGSELSADAAVLAVGAWSRELAQKSGFFVPVADLAEQSTRTHSLLGITEPTSIPLQRIVISNRLNVRPRHDGRMWVQVARLEERVTEGDSQQMLEEVGSEMEAELERFFGQKIAVEKVYYSGRSFPEDGHSIIGFLDDAKKLYAIVTHSGMTLGPLFGRLAAEELEGQESELLADFRPSRFADGEVESADFDYFIGRQ
ncbi:FAD-binding oxidoreductase [Brevibacterium sp. p3-SID960]|uniref:NAD(P)/FAD-dependent oxidoreductase n=1 Tax=Brevibacterium sp. p3-SID960 TaxID=2916063 RepID=UPI0021A288B8|nr:FAD-binding oxidoreductase [Brevibacterium sp. p3-SID960]MCT1689561.1 FAD-binding oxidoreductase [Brevibacterium sp. p3-SID960]